MNIKRKIDHIVYAVKDLEIACNELEELLGVRPVFGGYHRTQGTKNALLNLGNQCYLELLATDESNTEVKPPRWMGIDLIDRPQITRWAIKSSNLEQDSLCLKNHNSDLGKINVGQRKMQDGNLLKWRMILPTAHPKIDILPFMVDWEGSSHHPTDKLLKGCRLVEVKLFHFKGDAEEKILKELGLDLEVKVGEEVMISILVKGLKGIVELF
ncbi:MAG: VOC family protein [Chitinophagales bacterium]